MRSSEVKKCKRSKLDILACCDPHFSEGSVPALLDGLGPIPDKYIGLNIHQVLARIVRRSFAVHKTVPAALEWAQSGRSLLEEKINRRTNMFISEFKNFLT